MLINTDLPLADEIDALGPAPKKRGSPERAAQVAVVKYLRWALPAGSVVFAVKNEHGAKGRTAGARMRFGAMRKAEGVAAGFPDLGILLPGGRAVFCEMKAPRSGRISPSQHQRHEELRQLGFTVIVASSIEGVETALRTAGVPLCAITGAGS